VARVVLGVGGGIAAYKVAALLRLFTEDGHDVRVVPTRAALEFVGAPTWAALSGHPVSSEVWDDVEDVPHVTIGRGADLVVVAPATADLLARAAHGLADDLLTNTLLTVTCPVLMAPAMHTEMWQHPATQANVSTLRDRGVAVLDPASGRLTGSDTGPGRLPEPPEIYAAARDLLGRVAREGDLAGRTVVVSAGGTREALDPVRFLGNRSSGRQGYALAVAARDRGAEVTVVAANVALVDPPGVKVVPVESAEELRDAMLAHAAQADVVVMSAAVADFRPKDPAPYKIKKTAGLPDPIELVANPDILSELAALPRAKAHQLVIGFAAETGDESGDVLAHARTKLARKGCDLLVVNEVGAPGSPTGFETDTNAVTILGADGSELQVPLGTKAAIAHAVVDAVVERLGRSPRAT
jgi:phosphopantothenoylcysteine decarboxylase/phosphopantothenate--cysteine ligase